jgi:hypothetical protein
MNDIQKRFLLFLIGCIGTRFLFVLIAKNAGPKYLPLLGYLALLPAIGFMYIFLTGSRKTGGEVFGEKIWWNDLRPIHSLFYFLFAYNAIVGNNNTAWMYLLVDVIFGLSSFLIFHFNNGDFSKLNI